MEFPLSTQHSTTTDSPPQGPLLDRTDWRTFWSTFLVTLVAYWYTVAPTVTLEDAGELAVAADYLGVPHPPGYPIWTLLAWFFQWIFHFVKYNGYPNPAWGVAFMSAFFGALCCGCTAMLVSRSGKDIVQHLFKAERSLNKEIKLPAIGAGTAIVMGCAFLFLGKTIGSALLYFAIAYILISFVRNYFNEHPASIWMDCDQLGSLLFGFFPGLLLFISLWSGNQQALVFTIGLFIAYPVLDHLLGKAAEKPFALTYKGFNWLRWSSGFSSGLFLAFTPLMWSQATIVEVYSLNAFFLAIILLMTYLWMLRPSQNIILYIGSFLFGLGLTNHQSLLFLGLFLLVAIGARNRNLLKDSLAALFLLGAGFCLYKAHQYGLNTETSAADLNAQTFFRVFAIALLATTVAMAFLKGRLLAQWKNLLAVAGLSILGLSFHVYMPISSDQNPPMNWGYPRTTEGFKHALFRGQYEKIGVKGNIEKIGEQFASDGENKIYFFKQLGAYFYNPAPEQYFSMVNQFSIPLCLIGLLPILVMFRMKRETRTWMTTMIIGFFSVSVLFLIAQYPSLDFQDLFIKRVQYIQAHALYAVWIAYGLLILTYLINAFVRRHKLAVILSIIMALAVPAFPLYKNAYDKEFLEVVGSSDMRGHDFGWQFGYYQLTGAQGIMEEVEPEEAPLPNPNYPPAMEQGAIFFGGTDPGRFVPTYMIYSADVRPDVYLITQNALADNTYMNIMRDLYGKEIWIPDQNTSNKAFMKYVQDVKSGRINAGADVNTEGGKVSVQGVGGVMAINGILCKNLHDKNKDRHAFYIEESYVIPWMYPYLTPHGLIMKLNAEPTPLTPELIKDDFEFWEWYTERLVNDPAFQRDVIARKTFSKLRGALAGLYSAKGQADMATKAYKQSVALYPLSSEANFRAAQHLMGLKKYVEAREIMETYQQKDARNKQIAPFLRSIEQFENLNNRRMALEEKFKGKAMDVQGAFELMALYHNLRMTQQMNRIAVSLIRQKNLPNNYLMQLIKSLENMKRHDLALQGLQEYIKRAPTDYNAYIQLSSTYLKTQKYAESLGALQKAISLGDDEARNKIRNDKRFEILITNPTFKRLVGSAEKKQGFQFGRP